MGILAGSGVVWAACYLLWLTKRFLFGSITNKHNEELKDLNAREIAILLPLVVLIIWFGVYPKTFFKYLEPSIRVYLNSASSQAIAERTQSKSESGETISPKKTLTIDYNSLGAPLPSFESRLKGYTNSYAILLGADAEPKKEHDSHDQTHPSHEEGDHPNDHSDSPEETK